MELRELSLQEMKDIYEERMREDFPDNERRPFSSIRSLYGKKEYEGLGLFDQEALAAYAFLIREAYQGRISYLIDYIAVDRQRRGRGIGTVLMKELSRRLSHAGCVIVEVENPDYADTPEEKEERERRIRFYERCGMRDTGASEWLYYVEYRLLELPTGRLHTKEEIYDAADYFYRRMLPPHLVDKYLHLHREDKS